jgi:hypothetical protein
MKVKFEGRRSTDMIRDTSWRRAVVGCSALVLVGAGVVWAQASAMPQAADGSMAALVAEVRQLRAAVETSTRTQTQTQALGVYLSAQQSRIAVIGSRLDAVRAELVAAKGRARDTASLVAHAQRELAQAADAGDRSQADGLYQMFKQQADRAAETEQDLRRREADVAQSLQLEEQRWAELIGRLEQTIKK